jgi:hypothetical protein
MENKKLLICISFHYVESRIENLKKIVDCFLNYKLKTTIVIDCNQDFNFFKEYDNIIVKTHNNLSHPFHLTSMHRLTMVDEIDYFDYFMYIEDDMLVPYTAIKYWLKHSNDLIKLKYNLGFLRIEIENDIEYCTDLYNDHLDTIINLNDNIYCVNNKNPYCAFWIYSKEEFNNFINSGFYQCYTINGYGTREQSAIGLHGLNTNYYKETVIPIVNNKLDLDCRIYHMPNNYVVDKTNYLATIKFDEAIKKFPFI